MSNTSNPAMTAHRPRTNHLASASDSVFQTTRVPSRPPSHSPSPSPSPSRSQEATIPPPSRGASATVAQSTTLTLVANNRTTQMSSSSTSSNENTVLERKTQHVSDEQSAVDTLPEGVPVSNSGDRSLIIDIVSALSGEQPGEDDLANLPTGEGPTIDEASLPTRRAFDEEPTRKKHAPKPPPRELTDVSDVHELFKDWNNN